MRNENVDPVYAYVDNEVKKLRTEFSKESLTLSRAFGDFEMNFTQYHMKTAIRLNKLGDSKNALLREKIASRFGEAREAMKHSLKPSEPLKIADEFREACVKISKEYGLGAFTD